MGSISQIRKPPHQKTMGVEIECYPKNVGARGLLWSEGARVGFWEATEDGSLGLFGIEWVCQPMPYSMIIHHINKLHKAIGGWKIDDRCGLHIHVGRGWWSNERETKFTKFLKTLTTEQIVELFGRYNGAYANPHASSYDKYRAVNLLHTATYEFRLWAAGDLTWTLEAVRRTRLIVQHRGKWSYEICLDLFTRPE